MTYEFPQYPQPQHPSVQYGQPQYGRSRLDPWPPTDYIDNLSGLQRQARQDILMRSPIPMKSVGVAYVLLLTVGLLGIHHFYLNKVGRGIGYLFTFGWFGIGWFIDLCTLPSQVRMVNAYRMTMYHPNNVNVHIPPRY
jgi:hypothetical protein